jgi:hypothetical protein
VNRTATIVVLVSATAAFAVVVLIRALAAPGLALDHTLWFWIVACVVGEGLWLRLPVGNATLSMASCFNLAALLVLPMGHAVIATALASIAVEATVMRKPWVRCLYNASHTVLAVGAASAAFTWLAGGERDLVGMITNVKLVPFAAAALVYYAVNRVAVTLAVAVHEGLTARVAWERNFGNAYEVLSTGAVFSLGILLAVHYAGIGMVGTLLVLLPLVLAADGYRRFTQRDESVPGETPKERKAA